MFIQVIKKYNYFLNLIELCLIGLNQIYTKTFRQFVVNKRIIRIGLALVFSFIFSINVLNSQCFKQLTGEGLYLFSPLKTKLTKYKPLPGKEWGDSILSNCAGYGPAYFRKVAPGYIVSQNETIYASHSGIIRIFTSGGNNEANDACWIDGENFSTAYFNIYFTVSSSQFVYAGQKIGNVIPRKDTSFIYYNIRQSKPIQPLMKRGGLPIKGDKECSCYIDPIWPEYFVNPTDWHIYWEYNNSEPVTVVSVNISPSWVGNWSFDGGKTWLKSGEVISGLPQKYYKILFQEKKGWKSPLPIEFVSKDNNNTSFYSVKYSEENSTEHLLSSKNTKRVDSLLSLKDIDSIKNKSYDSSYKKLANSVYTKIHDSINNQFSKIESIQNNVESKNKTILYETIFLFFLLIGLIVLFSHYNEIKKQKRNIEVLQKELHHRVRNNLGIISGLVDATIDKNNLTSLAIDLENRIKSISFVHEQLYQQNDVTKLNLQEFLVRLSENLVNSYSSGHIITYDVNAMLLIDTKLATQLALIVSELITNCLKHGIIVNKPFEISITAELLENKKLYIKVSDNGKGFPEPFDYLTAKSFGIRMVVGLIKQMKGDIKFSNKSGSITEFTF